jgi:hypothetical protein
VTAGGFDGVRAEPKLGRRAEAPPHESGRRKWEEKRVERTKWEGERIERRMLGGEVFGERVL